MSEDKYFDQEFCSLAEKLLATYHLPSISIAVVDNGKTYSKAFGLARFPDTPATPDTLYFAGSTTKAMLAAAIGVVIHDPAQNRLDHALDEPLSWSTPLRSILGEGFVLGGDKYITDNVTIEDSLSHRIGFQGADLFYGPYIGSQLREITKRLRYLGPVTQQFRTAMQYNNYMFAAAGDALETITGKPCGEVVRSLLWKPIGMDRTFWHLQDVVDAPHIDKNNHLSRGYYWVKDSRSQTDSSKDGFYVPVNYANFAGVAPAGAVISSVLDYAKWIEALLNASTRAKEDTTASQPISSTLFTELTAPRISGALPIPRQSHLGLSTWGLGWQIIPSLLGPRHPMITHDGGLMGYGAHLCVLPNDSFGVITLGNSQLLGNLIGGILAQELMSRKFDLKATGREEALRDFNMLMEAQMVGLRHAVEYHSEIEDINNEDHAAMFKMTIPPVGKDIKSDEFIHSSDKDIKSILQHLEGTYEHPAYGSFRVSFAPAPLSSASSSQRGENKLSDDPNIYISHRFCRDKEMIKAKDSVRATTHSLKIDPIGQRVWSNTYLLHPRVVLPEKEPGTAAATTKAVTTWFDQESFNVQGDITSDVVTGLPSGADGEDGDGSGRCRMETCFESTTWTRFGTAFIVEKADGEGGSRDRKEEVKMGMSLGNSSAYADGTRDKGWEGKKVWFVKKVE